MISLTGLFSFEGRARRSEWWLTTIGVAILGSLFITVVSLTASGGDWSNLASSSAMPVAIVVLNLAVGALVFWIQTAVGVRRSHDRGQSGVGVIAYQLTSYGWSFIPMVVLASGLEPPPIPFAGAFLFAFAVILVICAVYFLVTLGFLSGEPTANAYGQTPKTV
ncbi:DUF805 domain-containing protein [Brevundimonas sp.]|uniref:DUF805 domain-containing protein n=1 Tax=Brevundimonas sp. TaxID=1871086 RepID=UPI003D0C15D6